MGKIFLTISMVGLLMTVGLLLYIFAKKKTANLHAIWDLALAGDKLARAYCYVAIGSFACAVVSVFLMRGGI
jgi:hypothetical protein